MKLTWPPTKRTVIIVSLVISLILVILTVVAIIEKNRKDALNPGGTGGGYVPKHFVTLKGVDPSLGISDNYYIAIRAELQEYLQNKYPNQDSYTVTADKKTFHTTRVPSVYQYTSFNVTSDKNEVYTVVFFVDFTTTQKTVLILENNIYRLEGIAFKNIQSLYKAGMPEYVTGSIQKSISDSFKPENSVVFQDPSVNVTKTGARTYKVRVQVDNTINLEVSGTFYYSFTQSGTATVKNIASGQSYTIDTLNYTETEK